MIKLVIKISAVYEASLLDGDHKVYAATTSFSLLMEY